MFPSISDENYPIVDIESNSYIVRFLDTLTIKCYVQENEEYPVRRIYWQYINNGVITLIESGNKGIAGSTIITPSLTIEMVTTSESGLYTCFATNDAGTAKSKPIQVIVNGGVYLNRLMLIDLFCRSKVQYLNKFDRLFMCSIFK